MKKGDKKRLVLLDAHALLHRAYHALPEFANSKGVPTGGLYGYLSMILRIATEFHPDYIVACYDLPQKTFRHEAYEAYKGTRSKTDEALVEQIKLSRILCERMNIPIYDVPGFEADDMLGTIVEQTKDDKGLEVMIATGDMDSLQLVDKKRVRVFTLKKGINDTVIYDEDGVRERYGFDPEQLTDYKGLRGDPSDNILGVPGIGEKTATDIILLFGTIEKLYAAIKKDRTKVLEKGIKERIVKLLEEHEEGAIFSKTLATIRRDAPISFSLPEKEWKDGLDLDSAVEFMRDLEFKSLVQRLKDAVNPHPASSGSDPLPKGEGAELEPVSKEVKIAAWLLNSDQPEPSTHDVLAMTKAKTLEEALPLLEKEIDEQGLGFVYRSVELPLIPILESMRERGVLIDTDFLKKLSEELHARLSEKEREIWNYAGKEFNVNSPKQLGEILFGEMMIHASVKGFKVKKTATGTYSTKEGDLEKLADVHPIIPAIFEYRELQKLLSTYIDSLPGFADAEGRIHPELIQTGAVTGRFSSQNPSIQNIPIRGETGKRIRKAFIAPKGWSVMAADYSQIELRSAAILSGDPVFIETFTSEKDVHASVASRVFHVPENEVTGDMRRRAKVINFGILYGMGVTSLQKSLGTNRAEAQAFYDEYFKQLPKLSEYIDETITRAKKKGYTETLFGRRRHFPGLRSSVPFIKAMAERAASNAPIQGTTADMIKLAMIQVEKSIETSGLSGKVRMVMQIHDELVFEVEDSVLAEAEKVVRDAMEGVLSLSPHPVEHPVPLTVSVSHGKTWGDAKD